MMRVLLVEDNAVMAAITEKVLREEKFIVDTTDLGEDGLEIGKLYDYDIILLDLNLPDMSGYEVLRSLRVTKIKTPILILSGLAGIEDKVKGLGVGADDYMTKPFHKDELVARIHAIVRRSKGHAQSVIRTGDITNHLYGGMDEPELKIIDVFICKLRKKLANASEGRNFIETVWGRGYVLREPHEVEERIPA